MNTKKKTERDLEAAATLSKASLLRDAKTEEDEVAQYIGSLCLEAENYFAEKCQREADLTRRINEALELEEAQRAHEEPFEEEGADE